MKQKFKISQLAAKPIEVELEHPTAGKTGIFIKLVGPQSKQFRDALDVFQKSENTEEDNLKLFASCLVGWDEEAFEKPFSVEAAVEFFSAPENAWAANFLIPIVKDHTKFFRPLDGKAV